MQNHARTVPFHKWEFSRVAKLINNDLLEMQKESFETWK